LAKVSVPKQQLQVQELQLEVLVLANFIVVVVEGLVTVLLLVTE
jgi:hypothetical protein